MHNGRTLLAFLIASAPAFTGDTWKYHFGRTPSGVEVSDPASLPLVVDTSKTRLELGAVLPRSLEFEGVLVNRGTEPQHLSLEDGGLSGVGRVKVGLPEDTTIPAGGTITFKVRYDAHGEAPGPVKIPLVFRVGETGVLLLEFRATIKEVGAWVLPHRILLTPGDGTPGSAKTSTRFDIRAFDGQAYDGAELEDANTPVRIVERDMGKDGIQGRVMLDPQGLAPDGKPAPKQGEVRLAVTRNGAVQDTITIQWNLN